MMKIKISIAVLVVGWLTALSVRAQEAAVTKTPTTVAKSEFTRNKPCCGQCETERQAAHSGTSESSASGGCLPNQSCDNGQQEIR